MKRRKRRLVYALLVVAVAAGLLAIAGVRRQSPPGASSAHAAAPVATAAGPARFVPPLPAREDVPVLATRPAGASPTRGPGPLKVAHHYAVPPVPIATAQYPGVSGPPLTLPPGVRTPPPTYPTPAVHR